jgi:hypothetical protein
MTPNGLCRREVTVKPGFVNEASSLTGFLALTQSIEKLQGSCIALGVPPLRGDAGLVLAHEYESTRN